MRRRVFLLAQRERSARAVENCNLAFLTRDDVVKVATDYPTMEVRLRNLATRRAKKDDKLLKELIAEKQKKEEDVLMQQLAAVSGAAVAFAGRIEMSADEMELYEAALKIQKVRQDRSLPDVFSRRRWCAATRRARRRRGRSARC